MPKVARFVCSVCVLWFLVPVGRSQDPVAAKISKLVESSASQAGKRANGPIRALTQGNCSVNKALQAISEHNPTAFVGALKEAREQYANGAKDLQELAKEPSFQRPLAPSAYSVVVDARFRNLNMLSDIITRMSQAASTEVTILERVLKGEGTETDVNRLVQTSADLTSFVAMFLKAAALQEQTVATGK